MERFSYKFLVFSFLLVCTFECFSQNSINDSLIKELNKAKHDTDKLKLLTEIAWNYAASDLKKSREYANQELELAQKTNNQKYIAAAYNDLGIILIKESKFKESLELQKKALAVRLKLPSQLDIASSYFKIGYCYSEMADYINSLDADLKALDIYVKLKNKIYEAYTLNTICNVCYNLKNYDKQLVYAERSYTLAKEVGDKAGIANALNYMASAFGGQKNFTKAIEKEKEAFEIFKQLADSNNMAPALSNIGFFYQQLNNYNKAVQYYLPALTIVEKNHDTNSEAVYNNNLGSVYLRLKQYAFAEKYLKKAEELANQQSMSDLQMLNYNAFGEFYARTGKADEAIKYYAKYTQLQDSLFSKETAKQLSDMEVKYETKQKEEENIILTKENDIKSLEIKQQKTQRNILIVGFSMLLLLGVFIYNSTRLKHRNKILVEKELRTRAIFEAQEKEKIHLSKELHDGLGPLLSLIKMNVSTLKPEPESQKLITEIKELTNESIKEVRAVSHALMPSLLQKQGLQAALTDFIEQVGKTGALKTTLNFNISTKLLPETEVHLYRIVQEAINNTIKHSGANEAKINVIETNHNIELTIADNGKGFASDKDVIVNGNGLNNIYSRVDFLKGKIDLDTAEGKGTIFRIQVPVNELNNA